MKNFDYTNVIKNLLSDLLETQYKLYSKDEDKNFLSLQFTSKNNMIDVKISKIDSFLQFETSMMYADKISEKELEENLNKLIALKEFL